LFVGRGLSDEISKGQELVRRADGIASASGAGTNRALEAYLRLTKAGEISMKMAKIVLAGSAALTILSSVALAQNGSTGTITKIDRLSGTIAIRQAQSGTVGASTGGAAEEFKAQDGLLNAFHAGDRVTFSATETGGTKTITKLEKQ
jgi:Cu/Ag efflux protein CusF